MSLLHQYLCFSFGNYSKYNYFSLLCNFYKTLDEISPVATVILVFCLIVLILQSVYSVLSFMRCFLPAYLTIITTRFTLPNKNLVENELTLHTSLENSVQPESPISVSGQDYRLQTQVKFKCKLPAVPPIGGETYPMKEDVTSADVDENIYSVVVSIKLDPRFYCQT